MILPLRHLKHNGKKTLVVSKVGLNIVSNCDVIHLEELMKRFQ
jgi:hypothetical protein